MFARKVLAMNPATYLYACMARSVRSYAISVVLRLAIHAGTISTCIGRFLATDITTRQSRSFQTRWMHGRGGLKFFKQNNKQDYEKGISTDRQDCYHRKSLVHGG